MILKYILTDIYFMIDNLLKIHFRKIVKIERTTKTLKFIFKVCVKIF